MQIGKSGGHVQPPSCLRRNCLTSRSSSEWNEMTREPAARAEHLERRRQRPLDRAELVVHLDPQCLEDALGRVPLAEARRRGNRGLDRLDEIAGALERLGLAPPDDRACDLSGRTAPRRSA